jgi:hypothetical protein
MGLAPRISADPRHRKNLPPALTPGPAPSALPCPARKCATGGLSGGPGSVPAPGGGAFAEPTLARPSIVRTGRTGLKRDFGRRGLPAYSIPLIWDIKPK